MAIILKDGTLFLHVPKTGGNWVTRILREQDLVRCEIGHKHATYDHICNPWVRPMVKRTAMELLRHGRVLEKRPRIFAIVRHPKAWYESWFRYQTHQGWRCWGAVGDLACWHVNADLNACAAPDFNAFMRAVNRRLPGYVSQLFARYVNCSGATVLKTEGLADDLADFLSGTSLPVDVERIRQAPPFGASPAREIAWEDDVLEETRALERPALQRFGYEF